MRLMTIVAASGLALLVATAFFGAPQPGDEIRGKDLFARRCSGCHSLDHPMEGPALRNVYGRRAGSAQDFRYSDALKSTKFTWDEVLLDKWLTDTESLVPDNDMSFRVASEGERRDIIAYLKSLSLSQ
jgi:cytochrome c